MSLKEILLELENYVGIITNLDHYLASITPIGGWETNLRTYKIRKASINYIETIKQRVIKLESLLYNTEEKDIDTRKEIDYVNHLADNYIITCRNEIAILAETITNSFLQNGLAVELVAKKEDWNFIGDNAVIDSIYTCDLDHKNHGFFISFTKEDRTDNYFMDSANESFGIFCNKVLSHVNENTVYLSNNGIENKIDLDTYLNNIQSEKKETKKSYITVFTEAEIKTLDQICSTLTEPCMGERIYEFENDVSSFFQHLENPDKISNAIVYIEKELKNYCCIKPLSLTNIKIMNIISLLLFAISKASGSDITQIISAANLTFNTSSTVIDVIATSRNKQKELEKYKDNLRELRVKLFNDLKLAEVVEPRKTDNINIKLASGQVITVNKYHQIQKKLKINKKDSFKLLTDSSVKTLSRMNKVTTTVTSLALITTMTVMPLFNIIKDSLDERALMSEQTKIQAEIAKTNITEEEYASEHGLLLIKDHLDSLMELEKMLGDYYLLYEYMYEVEVPVERPYVITKDGKEVTKTRTEYEKETRFDYSENPNHPNKTGMMQVKYTTFKGYDLHMAHGEAYLDVIESNNLEDFASSAEYYLPDEVVAKTLTPRFSEEDFSRNFDETIFRNNIGFEIPKHLLGKSK